MVISYSVFISMKLKRYKVKNIFVSLISRFLHLLLLWIRNEQFQWSIGCNNKSVDWSFWVKVEFQFPAALQNKRSRHLSLHCFELYFVHCSLHSTLYRQTSVTIFPCGQWSSLDCSIDKVLPRMFDMIGWPVSPPLPASSESLGKMLNVNKWAQENMGTLLPP